MMYFYEQLVAGTAAMSSLAPNLSLEFFAEWHRRESNPNDD
jgi:hypothetical protein